MAYIGDDNGGVKPYLRAGSYTVIPIAEEYSTSCTGGLLD